jgi:release factor glutamine methyltransferase
MSIKKDDGIGNLSSYRYHTIFKKFLKGELSNKEKKQFLQVLKDKRVIGESKGNIPLEYIFGKAMFMGNILKCTPKTFIPRKDTELLVNVALDYAQQIKKNIIVFDIGTGTGNIAISLALKIKHIHVFSSDISSNALGIAQENVSYYHLDNKITLLYGGFFTPHQKYLTKVKADIIICNPPYIPTKKLEQLPPEIANYEPINAFDGGPYGLNIFKEIISRSPHFLKSNGLLLFEFGAGQEGLIERLFSRNGLYHNITYYKYNNEKRVVSAIYNNK